MSAIGRVDHVNIRVPPEEIAALSAFYVEFVGLRVGPRPPFKSPGVWLYAGEDPIVHLSQLRPDETIPPLAERASAFNHVAFACAGFAAAAARLAARGIGFRVTEVPLTQQRQIFFRDPSGVGIELLFALDEDAG
jgi:glyoxylase I family protein